MANLWTDLIGVIINPDGTDEELDDIIFELWSTRRKRTSKSRRRRMWKIQ
jgi:hypothetical protein